MTTRFKAGDLTEGLTGTATARAGREHSLHCFGWEG